MSTLMGALRRRALAPSLHAVSLAGRGFPVTPSAVTAQLDRVPQSVVCGFEWGVDTVEVGELARRLDFIEPELRGFGYEGAAMAWVILDAMRAGRTNRARALLLGPGQPHIFLTYIGIGFALARLPRGLWKKVVPDLTGSPYHPTMSWLAVDGYGFDLAYFHPRRWVDEQRVPKPYPWQDAPEYFPRAVDQGIGRALWFMHGADVDSVGAAVARFPGHRQADLWSGVGLAATFAGGATDADLTRLRAGAGDRWTELALGAVFAAKARSYAGFVPAHTEAATAALGAGTVAEAVALADGTEDAAVSGARQPAYELWRQRIRAELAAAKARLR
ncbi:DUF1702 family protein [Actinomycetes bacterium KLBMP 9797]